MSDNWFRVEVTDHQGQIVAIETEMLVGRDIGEREQETVINAIRNLQGFIGDHCGECEVLRQRIELLRGAIVPCAVCRATGFEETQGERSRCPNCKGKKFVTLGSIEDANNSLQGILR